MLELKIADTELWDEKNEKFIHVKGQTLLLEHSLVSLSKWEGRWRKPFLSANEKTIEETVDYIRCMTLNEVTDPAIYDHLPSAYIDRVNRYINDTPTATRIKQTPKGGRGRDVTAEVIYGWLVGLNIPFECENWQLNRLFTLIQVCDDQQKPPKKMSQSEILRQNAELNARRRKRRK